MSRHVTVALATVVLVLAASATAFAVSAPKLKGSVGPGFTISLKDASGKAVKSLKAGKYNFVIADKSDFHNFALKKNGKFVKALTTVAATAKAKSVPLTLGKGTWKFYCEPHESSMKGTFKVT